VKVIENNKSGKGLRVGIVQARFNQEVTDKLVVGAQRALKEAGVADERIVLVRVPGALEIPLALQAFCESGEYDALVAIGTVIKGDTYHFEVVCNESAAGITRVALDFSMPIGNGVLTTYTESQAHSRADQKGYEAAQAALEMVGLEDSVAEAVDD
jgi:6,7-dimethyl-8-ribityllumazine synthase